MVNDMINKTWTYIIVEISVEFRECSLYVVGRQTAWVEHKVMHA